MNEIARVKKGMKLAQWAEMIRQRNESGLTVTDWCKENGINLKTYYYRLKRMRQAVCNEIEQHDIVPVVPNAGAETTVEKIELSVGDVNVSLPDNFNEDTLRRLLGVSDWRTKRNAAAKARKYQMTDDEAKLRITELERENAELRKANDILKDALGFFAKDRKK
mgnify:CR=1 FL=1|jgi:putative transposase